MAILKLFSATDPYVYLNISFFIEFQGHQYLLRLIHCTPD